MNIFNTILCRLGYINPPPSDSKTDDSVNLEEIKLKETKHEPDNAETAKTYDVFSNQSEQIPNQTIAPPKIVRGNKLSSLIEELTTTSLNFAVETESEGVMFGQDFSFAVSKNATGFVGTYEIQDWSGRTWILILNADCSARMIDKKKKQVYYASWDTDYFTECPEISFDGQNPTIAFVVEKERIYSPVIIGNYLYYDERSAKAQNPLRRLVVKKTS
jgi:hypothetical protein